MAFGLSLQLVMLKGGGTNVVGASMLRTGSRTHMPAALPALAPLGASSNTRQAEGSGLGSNWSAAKRKMSGAGLPCRTVSPAKVQEKAFDTVQVKWDQFSEVGAMFCDAYSPAPNPFCVVHHAGSASPT